MATSTTRDLTRLTIALLKFIIETSNYDEVKRQIKLVLWFLNKRSFKFGSNFLGGDRITKLVLNEFEYDVDYTISQSFKNGDDSEMKSIFESTFDIESQGNENENEEKQDRVLQHQYLKRVYVCPFGRTMDDAVIFDIIDNSTAFITFKKLEVDIKMRLSITNGNYSIVNRGCSPETSKYVADTYVRVLPMITGASMGSNSNRTNNIAEIVNNILKNHTSLLQEIDSMDVMMKKFEEILDADIRKFWLEHGKSYGKDVKKLIKETNRELAHDKPIPNLVRELHLQWRVMTRQMKDLYPKMNDQMLIDAFEARDCAIGNVKLCKSNISFLNKSLHGMANSIPSHSGMFVPSILAFCRKQIKFLETEKDRRNRVMRENQ